MAKFDPASEKRKGWQHPVARRVIIFMLLFGLWLLLSGSSVVEFIVFGAAACALVVFLTSHLLEPSSTEEYKPLPQGFLWLGHTIVRFLFYYLPWLIFEIGMANVQVAYLILHPKLPISPRLLTFRTTLDSEPSQILLSQSITLTPGTITIDMERSEFVIHALFAVQDQILEEGGMQDRVARVFGEVPDPAPPVRIITDINDIKL